VSFVRYVSGLDLGQSQDFSALVVTEQVAVRDERGIDVTHHRVRHLHRWALKTPYPQVVADVKDLFAKPPLTGGLLAVDRTGVGAAVYDQFRDSGISAAVSGWLITHGIGPGLGTAPKVDLVGAIQTVLGQRRLQIAPDLALAETLARELEMFRVRITGNQNETFASWRERDHDDLVLALALAVWRGERLGPPVSPMPPHFIYVASVM
jgi:hypothetical protein